MARSGLKTTGVSGAAIEKLFSITQLAETLSVSRRTLERERAAGRFPKPDAIIGTRPRWKPSTVRAWIDDQAA